MKRLTWPWRPRVVPELQDSPRESDGDKTLVCPWRRHVETTGDNVIPRESQAGRSFAGNGTAKERRRGAGSCAAILNLRGSAIVPRFPTSAPPEPAEGASSVL